MARHQLLHDCWATMDGLKLYLQQAGNSEIQEYVTSAFGIYPDETIPITFFNAPGSVHNSQVAELGKICSKLEHDNGGWGHCVDLAFGNLERKYLLKLGQDLLVYSAPTHHKKNLEHQLR